MLDTNKELAFRLNLRIEMYYYIKGKLAYKGTNFIVVDANGVGYEIYTSLTSIQNAGEVGRTVTAYTHLYVREDTQDLYGFLTEEERNMFLTLISVSGVGPKAALAILSAAAPAKLAAAVITGDVKTLTKAQGVGPKLAQRIILELKDKIKNADLNLDLSDGGEEIAVTDNMSEAVSALVALGYSVQEAKKAVEKVDGSLDVEEIIKKALAKLF